MTQDPEHRPSDRSSPTLLLPSNPLLQNNVRRCSESPTHWNSNREPTAAEGARHRGEGKCRKSWACNPRGAACSLPRVVSDSTLCDTHPSPSQPATKRARRVLLYAAGAHSIGSQHSACETVTVALVALQHLHHYHHHDHPPVSCQRSRSGARKPRTVVLYPGSLYAVCCGGGAGQSGTKE